QRFLAQPRALAFRAQRVAAVTAEEDAHMQLVLLGFQVRKKAADEIVYQLALVVRQVGEGRAETHFPARRLAEIAEPRAELGFTPRIDRAIVERQRFIGNHAVQVEIDRVAEALAARAGAGRRIETEQNRLWLGELRAARLALELLVAADRLRRRRGAFENHFAGFAIADLDRVHQPLVQLRPNRDAIHQDEHRPAEIDIEQRFRRRELERPPGLKQPREALLAQFEQVIA